MRAEWAQLKRELQDSVAEGKCKCEREKKATVSSDSNGHEELLAHTVNTPQPQHRQDAREGKGVERESSDE